MPYNAGTMMQGVGLMNKTANAPLPLDRIRARRMEREKAELEEFKADTERGRVSEYRAAGTDKRRREAETDALLKEARQIMSKAPPLPPINDPNYMSKYAQRFSKYASSGNPYLQKAGEEMRKDASNVMKTLPLEPGGMSAQMATAHSENTRRKAQTDQGAERLGLDRDKLDLEKKKVKQGYGLSLIHI